ncbi:MAG: hypothetical protein H0W89_01185 [Candidatus Levybacteria bacterium]|nr:hypothetical protein [Candidatus Levybacteria bacterium]
MAGAKTKTHNSLAAHERLTEHGNKAVKEVQKAAINEANESGKTFLKQLLGLELVGTPKDNAVEVKQPEKKFTTSGIEIVDLFVFSNAKSEKKASSEKAPNIEAAMNYSRDIQKSSEHSAKSETHQMNQNVEEIKAELAKLVASSKVLKMEFAEIGVEQSHKEVGQYHTTFFEWMLIVIRQAREKVEDSGAWLNVVKGKKGKKGLDVTDMSMHQSGERTTIQNSAG